MQKAMCKYSTHTHDKQINYMYFCWCLPCILSSGRTLEYLLLLCITRSQLEPQPLLCMCCSDQRIPAVLFFCSVTHWSVAPHTHTHSTRPHAFLLPHPARAPALLILSAICSSLLLSSPLPALLLAQEETKPPSHPLLAHYRLFLHSSLFAVASSISLHPCPYVHLFFPECFTGPDFTLDCFPCPSLCFPLSLYLICQPVLTSFSIFLLISLSSPLPTFQLIFLLLCLCSQGRLKHSGSFSQQLRTQLIITRTKLLHIHPHTAYVTVTLCTTLCILILMQVFLSCPAFTLESYSFFLGQVLCEICLPLAMWCSSMFVLYRFA